MQEIPSCLEYGVPSLKLFMAYKGTLQVDDATLFRAMGQAAANGLLIMVHAENGDMEPAALAHIRRAGLACGVALGLVLTLRERPRKHGAQPATRELTMETGTHVPGQLARLRHGPWYAIPCAP